jgi:hypothetical protein
MDELVVVFAQSLSGKKYLLGVFESDQTNLRKVYDNFKRQIGGEVAFRTTELNKSGLFEI